MARHAEVWLAIWCFVSRRFCVVDQRFADPRKIWSTDIALHRDIRNCCQGFISARDCARAWILVFLWRRQTRSLGRTKRFLSDKSSCIGDRLVSCRTWIAVHYDHQPSTQSSFGTTSVIRTRRCCWCRTNRRTKCLRSFFCASRAQRIRFCAALNSASRTNGHLGPSPRNCIWIRPTENCLCTPFSALVCHCSIRRSITLPR